MEGVVKSSKSEFKKKLGGVQGWTLTDLGFWYFYTQYYKLPEL